MLSPEKAETLSSVRPKFPNTRTPLGKLIGSAGTFIEIFEAEGGDARGALSLTSTM